MNANDFISATAGRDSEQYKHLKSMILYRLKKTGKNLSDTVVAVDFDGTLTVGDSFSNDRNLEHTVPNMLLITVLLDLKAEHHISLILWTCRHGTNLFKAVEFCRKQSLEFDAVNFNLTKYVNEFGSDSRKIYADLYIDDKNL